MTSKSTASYKDVFTFFERHFNLNPEEFMYDFESGLRKALREMYPTSVIRGCWIHFSACIRKSAKLLGLLKLWNKSARQANSVNASQARKLYKMLLNLPLLPADSFMMGYKHIYQTAMQLNLKTKFTKLFQYFDRTWIVEV